MAVRGSQGQQESKPQGASLFQASSVTQNKSRGQAKFRGKRNWFHLLVEGFKTSHCKDMDAGKEIICGHFYNLSNLSRWRWKLIRRHLFKPEAPLGGKEKEVGYKGVCLLLLRISALEGASNAWLHRCLGILHIFQAKYGPFHCWSALLIGNFCLQLTWSHWFYSSL